jgi:general secretion pathway protein K
MIVLVLVGILSTLVLSTLMIVRRNTERIYALSSDMEAAALAQKGIAIGVHPSILRDEPLLQFKDKEFDEGYFVKIYTEAARLNINGVLERKDKSLLRDLFVSWGLDDVAASKVTDALIDWEDANELAELNGAEKDYYSGEGFNDRPYNKPFANVEDMQLVKDFDLVTEVKPNWKDYFTVFGDRKLDIHETGTELLAVALEMDPATVEIHTERVKGQDGILGTKDDIRYTNFVEAMDAIGVDADEEVRKRINDRFVLNSPVKRVVSVGYVGDTYKTINLVVRQSGERPIILFLENSTYTVQR